MNPTAPGPNRWRASAAGGVIPPDFVSKADICGRVLDEARKLSRAGQSGSLSNQLVARAMELLDDMDEILITLDPAANRPSFAAAATLHRELALVQVAIANHRRRRRSAVAADKV